ncbi:uncharacterized protein LOC132281082 [Cornus florida]|uniref:uncharacterized protein LOC132281082 n=1 Tax=Cornus florida TaxID=4283 RepID=UPI0028969733|nr:uncharacterized protein LOC132281082 [Cornus florida]
MEPDAKTLVQHCKPCQYHYHQIHTPPTVLHPLTAPWPFHTWGIVVTAFIREHIICRFGIPAIILSDNGTPFVNSRVAQLLQRYNITQRQFSAYYPKGNGQAETTNKSLLKIFSRTITEYKSNWVDQLPLAIWAHRTSRKHATGQTPFSLLYGTEAILPIEIAIPADALATRSKVDHFTHLKALDERRELARQHLKVYQHTLAKAYNKHVRPRTFQVGDLILKAAKHIMHNTSAPKFTPKMGRALCCHRGPTQWLL